MGRLSDALKALFGSNKTTGTYVPLVTSNGTPNGNISIDNIASLMGDNVFYGSPEIVNGTKFEDLPLGISYYANPHTASDAPTDIVQQTSYCQSIVIKRGNAPDMNRGFMVVINKWGIAVKFKGNVWDANWKYLITL